MNNQTRPSISHPIVFDGTDDDLSFEDFVRRLEDFWGSINPSALPSPTEIALAVPSHLYGGALRYYETLDPECQHDWSQLRNVMARKFPEPEQKEKVEYYLIDKDSLSTLAEAPPITSPMLKALGPAILEQEEHSGSAGSEGHGDHDEKSYISFSAMKERIRVHFSAPSPTLTDRSQEPQITVHSIIVEYGHGGTIWAPQFTVPRVGVNLGDPQSVAACRAGPLITIPSSTDAPR
ncbi:hypothetical protein FRC01_003330 [Tulasnella sp. 417]|nr:hypothetical protein FRC01_003330 [Tulasnella sp. 417]